jgi:uncharacterized membrane protein YphA (DoxX/SURF4 family)
MTDGPIRKLFISPWPNLAARFAIGAVFIYAGAAKLLDINAFTRTIDPYDILPDVLIPVAAIGLPSIEVLAGLGLIFDIKGSLSAISAMLIMFVIVLSYGILNNMDVDCGCFSPDEAASRGNLKQALLRDLVMIAAVIFLFISRRMRPLRSQRHSIWGKIRLLKGGSLQ